MNKINLAQVKQLIDTKHVVYLHARKRIICIDGFKYRSISEADLPKVKELLAKATRNL